MQMPILFEDLQKASPEAAQLVRSELEKQIVDVQQTMPGASGKDKQIQALKQAYDALDLLINAPGPVDFLVKELLIPALPDLIDYLVAELKKAGVLQ